MNPVNMFPMQQMAAAGLGPQAGSLAAQSPAASLLASNAPASGGEPGAGGDLGGQMGQLNSMLMLMMMTMMLMMLALLQKGGGGLFGGGRSGGGGGGSSVDGPGGNNNSSNTMTPASGGTISSLSADKDTRIKQIVDAAKHTYPDNPALAKLVASQALLESGLAGSSPSSLALKYNNLFGIKGSGTAGTVNMPTKEFENGHYVSINAGFAHNATVEDSFQQHKKLILGSSRYSNLRNVGSFEEAARLIRQDGYATDPNYTQSLISVYNSQLAKYF